MLGFITMGSFPYTLLLHVLIWPELKKIIRFTCTAVKVTLKGSLSQDSTLASLI